MSDPCTSYDPFTTSHTSQKLPLGSKIRREHATTGEIATFVYVKNVDLATTEGTVLTPASGTSAYTVSGDRAGGSAVAATKVVGVAVGAIGADEFGFIMCEGTCPVVYTDGGVSAGEHLVAHTVDGEADTMADGEEEQVFGVALADDSGTTESCYAYISC